MLVPPLETERLLIRAFRLEDLDVIHHILDIELRTADFGSEQAKTREERERWLQWTVLGYDELARLYQPPYGDRAVVLKSTQQVIGACGFVPSWGHLGTCPPCAPPPRMPLPTCTRRNLASIMPFPRPISARDTPPKRRKP